MYYIIILIAALIFLTSFEYGQWKEENEEFEIESKKYYKMRLEAHDTLEYVSEWRDVLGKEVINYE